MRLKPLEPLKRSFEPIAVVGQGCVLPDALDPAAFRENIAAGRVSLSAAPGPHGGYGGYVRDFDSVFEPDAYLLGPEQLTVLDPVFRWTLHSAREALRDSGHADGRPASRAGLVLGNLSFPSTGLARYAEHIWREEQEPAVRELWEAAPGPGRRPDPRNRFSSGLPAHLAARALGLGAGAHALDAACASSLYAVKLACDRLHDGTADLMLAGAVNRADDLFIHLGFRALSALSRSGRSRPFHRGADGLVPAEGAACVALMRLRDAVAEDRQILGVIRGIGLSNDGRDGSLLTPAEAGQVRAMRQAYESAGIDPRTVTLAECHATGTQIGDAVEIRAMSRVFDGSEDLPVGSVKSNLGHPVTAAGLAGLLKVLGAMETGIRPATVGADEPTDALTDTPTPLRLLRRSEPWDGPRRASVSAFGFGGNNAHLIVDAWEGRQGAVALPAPAAAPSSAAAPSPAAAPSSAPDPVAVVAIGARVGDGRDVHDLTHALLTGTPATDPRTTVDVELADLRFPPRDLDRAHAQQLLVMEAVREAVRGTALPGERTTVLVGMGCDPEVARHNARARAGSWAQDADTADALAPPLDSAAVLGTMPNVVANRLNAQLDLRGPSFTVSAEEASGLVALELAARALTTGEADAAVVGAVDLSHEPVHLAALAELGIERLPGDAAVALVLKRLTDARRDGDRVLALLDEPGPEPPDMTVGAESKPGNKAHGDMDTPRFDPAALFGTPHAATGLLAVACAALALHHRALPGAVGDPAVPALGIRTAEVTVTPLDAPPARARLRTADDTDTAAWLPEPAPRLHIYSGRDLPDTLAALAAGHESDTGPARLVIVAANPEQLAARAGAARRWLAGESIRPDGVAFRARPLEGEVAFVYTNGSAAYPGMGRELMLAFPEITAELASRCGPLADTVGWAYRPTTPDGPAHGHVLDQIWGAALLAQFHTEISRNLLGIAPAAALGYSSGESAALVSLRAWRDVRSLVTDIRDSAVFTDGVVGRLDAVRAAWAKSGVQGDSWASHIVNAPVDTVRKLIDGSRAVHLMAVNAPEVCVVGGEENECARLLAALPAIRLDYGIAVHAPEVEEVREQWRRLHHRPTDPVPGVRFYTGASGDWYTPTRDSAADAVTAQAVGTINFDRMVEKAYADGVRVFIEHGPRGLCTGWIDRILGDRDHLAVPLDASEGQGIRRLVRTVAELAAAGVQLNADALFDHLATIAPPQAQDTAALTFPAHPPAVRIRPPAIEGGQQMPRAPRLPAVLSTTLPAPRPEPVASGPQQMPRAPWLPPITPTETPFARQPRPQPDGNARLSRIQAATTTQQQQLTASFQEFMTQQSKVHHHFLAMRRRAEPLLRAGAPALEPAPHPLTPAPRPTIPTSRPGPRFTRAQLEHLATGRISDLFGPLFTPQDDLPRQTRMPQPPMLLADRVTGIDAVPASMGTGTIWTETDVRPDSWYLDPAGRMPAGLMVEAGQADLLLISRLGADLQDGAGDRVYRLLGCELTFHGSPPTPGETLSFEIRIVGHGEHDGVRLFFFEYDCHVGDELRLTVRDGQAGFFTDAELAGTGGVLWDPEAEAPNTPLPPQTQLHAPRGTFGPDAVRAFAEGRPYDCFGPRLRATRAHVCTPRIAADRMLLLGEVTELDPTGGPFGRGYLRAETPIGPEDWFFAGHFKDDPCMPGTLMLEGCFQAMAFHLAALGCTADRDGWRFEPVPDAAYRMLCRGQVTPSSRLLTYEVFVREFSDADEPTLVADVLCTVDGVKAFLARGLALRLVRDWPLEQRRMLGLVEPELEPEPEPAPESTEAAYGYPTLLASAWGRPSEAFPGLYGPAQDARRVPRLPGPPYHFISRVVSVDGPPGAMEAGAAVVTEYDVDAGSWYFEQNDSPVLPTAVLMEIALQPCGWLASYVGCALASDRDLLFRNLDGTATVSGQVGPDTATVRTRAELREISRNGDMVIVSFEVDCLADDRPVFHAATVFGFFPPEAFAGQAGLPPTDAERARLAQPCERTAELPPTGPMLAMPHRVTGYWPDGGASGLGRLRAEMDVDPGEWFFKAHFFSDPVQPGSLGVEAMHRLLQTYLVECGATDALRRPRFELITPARPLSWTYRGQVVPANQRVTVELEIREKGTDHAVAEAWLWADGTRIYHVRDLALRVVEGDVREGESAQGSAELLLDPAVDTWLTDHRPTWTVPTLPGMCTLDLLAQAATTHAGKPVRALRDVRLLRWIRAAQPVRLKTEVTPGSRADELTVTLLTWRKAPTAALSRFEPAATATVLVGERTGEPPHPFAPLPDAAPADDPYTTGTLFHGPAFQHLLSARETPGAASGVLDAARGTVPHGLLHPGLLDAALHVVPHDRLRRWSPEIPRDVAAFPHRVASFDIHAPIPTRGEVRVEARFAGFDADDRRLPAFDVQLSSDGGLLATFRLVEILLPKGRIADADPLPRRTFLRDRQYADGIGLSATTDGVTRLTAQDIDRFDWLPGTVADVYALPQGSRARDELPRIAIKDHIARRTRLHPSAITVSPDLTAGWPTDRPSLTCNVQVREDGEGVEVRDA
ncbi:beta-ketoacyl synthase N-terminal-like domain-containing protein [Streptomyces sp. NPDC047043]|uniref:beta-ketoacyl synthase N-terminal-like domain-containing protein n=1 Tax=Streptomyces sp. NPDC047043 TaxID=3154497 RepID=UPI0033FB6BFB